jgi:hypothetical protein
MGAPPRPPRQHDGMQLEQPARAAQPSAKSICQDRHRRGSARAGSMTVAQSSDLRNAWTLPNAVLGMEKPRRDCPLCGAFLRRDDESRQAVRRHKNKGSGGPFWGGERSRPHSKISGSFAVYQPVGICATLVRTSRRLVFGFADGASKRTICRNPHRRTSFCLWVLIRESNDWFSEAIRGSGRPET